MTARGHWNLTKDYPSTPLSGKRYRITASRDNKKHVKLVYHKEFGFEDKKDREKNFDEKEGEIIREYSRTLNPSRIMIEEEYEKKENSYFVVVKQSINLNPGCSIDAYSSIRSIELSDDSDSSEGTFELL